MLMMYKLPLTLTINAKNLLSVRDIIYVISNNLQVILDESNLTSIKTMYTLVHIFLFIRVTFSYNYHSTVHLLAISVP